MSEEEPKRELEPEPEREPEREAESGGEDVYAELERLREENAALAEQNRELLDGSTDVEQLRGELAEERGKREAFEEKYSAGEIERARLEILRDHPELKEHMELIEAGSPDEMRKRAEKLKEFSEARVAASRTALEREIAEQFGMPLGSSVEGQRTPEKEKARQEAVGAGDAEEVAGQVVEEKFDQLM